MSEPAALPAWLNAATRELRGLLLAAVAGDEKGTSNVCAPADDLAPDNLLARIDRIIAELAELRAEVAEGLLCRTTNLPVDADDLAEANLLEVSTAVQRFNRPPDSIRWMCRERDCGRKIGGRWMVSVPRLARYLNGGGET